MEPAGSLDACAHLGVFFIVALFGFYLLSQSTQAATLIVSIKDSSNKGVKDAVVALYAKDNDRSYMGVGTTPHAIMDQRNKQFVPHVLPIRVGTVVNFPNSDQIRHQVYSFSPAKPFELPLYHGETANPITFNRTGKVILGCNIHDRMIGYIYVLDTPYFAKTNAAGKARLNNLPAGSYRIQVRHPRARQDLASDSESIVLKHGARLTYAREISLNKAARRQRPLTPLEKRFHAIKAE